MDATPDTVAAPASGGWRTEARASLRLAVPLALGPAAIVPAR